MEDLGRFENIVSYLRLVVGLHTCLTHRQYWTWHYLQMKGVYTALCEGSILGNR